uniref:sensor histidine kinase n=1 Tax=Candidatus Ventrimonas sp. TaxID=3048889 RepID=UPI003FEDDFCD
MKKTGTGLSIKTRVLLFLGMIMAVFLLSNLYSIQVNRESERQMSRLLKRYYAINEFSRIYSQSMEAWMEYHSSDTEGSWERYRHLSRQLESLLQEMAEDTDEMSEEGFFMIQSVRNLYLQYQELTESPDSSGSVMHQELKLWELDELMKQYTEQLLQDSLTFGNTVHETLQAHVKEGQRNAVFFMAAVAVVCMIFGRYMTKWLLNPILSLASFVREVGKENFEVDRLPEDRNDEIGELNLEVNQMRDSMKKVIGTLQEKQELSRKLYDREMKLQKAKFSALQSQINPHFLFNTLNVIYGMADLEEAQVTGELIQSLSRLFRYSLENKAERVTLSRELTMIRDYIYIEKKRFGNRLSYVLRADADLEQYEIPPFTLQPLVENSIKHGILVRPAGGVTALDIREREEYLVIRVIDNGVGMDKEMKEALIAGKGTNGRGLSGIGVGNVFTRLKLMFTDCQIRILGRPGLGTCVEIKINVRECRK